MPEHTTIQYWVITAYTTSMLKNILLIFRQVFNVEFAFFRRFREAAATSNTRPWEAASVLKQVMRGFLEQRNFVDQEGRLSMESARRKHVEDWSNLHRVKQGAVTPAVPNCGEHAREEIPTISGYVDWAMRHPGSFTRPSRDWGLPYDHPGSLRPTEAYSTTL